MASKKVQPKPELTALAAVGPEDIGATFAADLRLASDDVLQSRGKGDLIVYEKLLSDDQVQTTFQQRRLGVVSREWYVEPGGETPLDQAAAEDLRLQLGNIEWDAATYRMLTGVFLGFSVAECMFGLDGKRVVLTGLPVRKSRRFAFDREGRLRLRRRGDPTGQLLPERKFWTFRAQANDDDDPYGLGLGHYLYWLVWFKRNGLRYWPLFLERFASPTPVAKVPPGSTPEELNKVLRLLDDVRFGGRLAIPNNVLLEFMQAMRSSGGDYSLFVAYLDACIAKVVLSQTMTTSDGSSRSQAEVHERVALTVVKSDADLLCASFNQGPAKWLTEWNFPGAAIPRVWRKVADAVDLGKQVTRDKTLFDMGYQPTQEYVDQTYGPGFKLMPKPGTVEPPVAPTVPEFADMPPTAGAIEGLIRGDEWRPLMGPELKAIEDLVDDAGSLEQVRDRLGELAKRDPNALVESLSRVMFAAHVAGQTGAELDDGND